MKKNTKKKLTRKVLFEKQPLVPRKQRMNKKLFIEELSNLSVKYRRLVWYARSRKQDRIERPEIEVSYKKVEKDYPEETKRLQEDETGYWEHGFNSGMLASTRLLLDIIHNRKEDGYEEFPFLDT